MYYYGAGIMEKKETITTVKNKRQRTKSKAVTGEISEPLPSACNAEGREIFAFPPHSFSYKQRMTEMGGNMRAR